MSGSFYSGQDGQLYVNDNKVAKVRSWSITVNQAILETVSLEDTDEYVDMYNLEHLDNNRNWFANGILVKE